MGLFPTSRPAWRWILDWILDNDLHILNDGSANQAIQITRNGSTTEIFLCGSNWSVKTSWRLAEPIGSSDHHPIIIELNHKICYKPVIPRSASWCRNGIDCSSFTNEVESKMSNLPHESNSSLHVSCFIASSCLQQLLTSEKLNPARDQNLGWLHMFEPKSVFEIASIKWSIKIARSGEMLVVKLTRQSTRPRQRVGKIFSKTQCQLWRSKHVESYLRSQRYSWC